MQSKRISCFVAFLCMACAGCAGAFKEYRYESIVQEFPGHRPTAQTNANLQKMTVEECIRKAMEGNLDYRAVGHRVEKAKSSLMEARSAFFPNITIGWRYFHADSAGAYFGTKLEQRKFQPPADWNHPEDFGSSNLSFGFSYRLNLGGLQNLAHKASQAEVAASEQEEDALRNVLVDAVVIAYYDALAASHFVEIAQQSEETVASQLKETEIKFQGGSALKSDILALQVRLASAQENGVKAKNRFRLSLDALSFLMGLGPNQSMSLEEKDWEPTKLPEKQEEGTALALAQRPELKQARERLLSARYGLDIAKCGYAPEVEFFGSYYFEDRDVKYSGKRDNWQLGAALSWRIFDGFRTHSRVVGARAILEEMRVLDQKTTLGIEHEVSAAYRNWEEASERTRVLELAVKQAEENMDLVKKQYEGGTVIITKYLDTELALTNTRYQLMAARYDLKKAKASVGKSLGLCGACVPRKERS